MLEIIAILLAWDIYYSVNTRMQFVELRTEVLYGTYPSPMFPDDPRHEPALPWWHYIFD